MPDQDWFGNLQTADVICIAIQVAIRRGRQKSATQILPFAKHQQITHTV